MKVGAAVFALALGGGLLAGSVLGSAGTTSAASNGAAVVTAATVATPPAPPAPETALDGDVATQVTAAAQAAVPDGTVDRVETDNDGVYEAHVTKADGTHVIVQTDYSVTAIVDAPQGGPGGPGGPGRHDGRGPDGAGRGETLLEGDTAASVTAAAQAAIPDGTVLRVETDSDGSPYEAHVAKADGTQVVLKIDASFTVTSTEDMPAPPQGDHQAPPAEQPASDQTATTTG